VNFFSQRLPVAVRHIITYRLSNSVQLLPINKLAAVRQDETKYRGENDLISIFYDGLYVCGISTCAMNAHRVFNSLFVVYSILN
jgi:hypothetical protein